MICTRRSDNVKIPYVCTKNLYGHKRYLVDGMEMSYRDFKKLYVENLLKK
jgi:hypothetical protein